MAALTGGSAPARGDPARLDYVRFRRGRSFSSTAVLARDRLPALIAGLQEARASQPANARLRLAHELLELDFTDVEAHLEKARLLHDRDARAAAFHERLALGLLRSLVEGGAVDDRRRPFRVYAPREQEAVLMFLDLGPLHRWSEGELDVVQARDRRGRLRLVYFQRG
jgi:hypothetical protein